MYAKRTFHFFTLAFLCCWISYSQETSNFLLFSEQLQWTNPAPVGLAEQKRLGILIDSQWLGIKDAPKQQTLFFDSYHPSQKLHFGALVRNRSRFAENSTQFFLQFAYPIQLANDTSLQLGAHAGGDFYELNFDPLSSIDGVIEDPLLQRQLRFVPNGGIGIHLKRNTYVFHLSFPRLVERLAFKSIPEVFLPNRFYFSTGLEKSFKTILDREILSLSLQLHNLGLDSLLIQLKGCYPLAFGKLLLGVNSAKNSSVGFQLHTQGVFGLAYAFEFPVHSSADLKLNNHSIVVQFKIHSKD